MSEKQKPNDLFDAPNMMVGACCSAEAPLFLYRLKRGLICSGVMRLTEGVWLSVLLENTFVLQGELLGSIAQV